MPTPIEVLQKTRGELNDELATLLAAEVPSDREAAAAAAQVIAEKQSARAQIDERLTALAAEESRRNADAEAHRKVGATLGDDGQPIKLGSEPRAYREGDRHSYFLDLARVELNRGDGDGGVEAARDRLQRHAAELAVELPAREARREAQAIEQNSRAGIQRSAFERNTNPNRTDGTGGYFVPPVWQIDEYIDLPRFGRTTANLCKQLTLPTGTDSINLPKISTGTTAAVQAGDAGGVSSTDLTDTSVSAAVKTLAGQQDIALQLLDQSPISFDEVVIGDLMADYNAKLDVQVINGSGSGGQATGILNVSGINAVTYTDATPTLQELWLPLLQSASKVAVNRKMAATGVVMTPSMWYWALSQLDGTAGTAGRPMIGNINTYNPVGTGGLLEADGPAGVFTYGLPAFMDGNVPSNLGAGTNETRVVTARWQDLYLWEGSMRTRVLSEVLSGTLQVRIQLYNYFAFMGNRRPESISVISGTGVIPTSGF